ncbi:MAG TPA: aerobic carbon-monoxide dehydrogenase large subunit [Ktedonobacterales bacterium]|nr:aerobic carbon-monoxide dehydrogenase large subunit [Ktedonobacterales bacterium]
MTTKLLGEPVKRLEDPRLLKGQGQYVDDIHRPGMLHGAVLRSPYAHARIKGIDVSNALALPGVHLVLSAADLGEAGGPLPLLIPHPALTEPRTQRALAVDEVRYVGEAVAFVVATNRYVAEDALELIEVDYEPLPVVSVLDTATREDAPLVHAGVERNIAAHLVQTVGDPDAAFARAAHVVKGRYRMDRGAANPMETRGIVAEWNDAEQSLTCWISTQGPIPIRNGLAMLFGLPEHKVRVMAPDVGGGFGPKIMMFYPEEILAPVASMRLKRPIKWIEDRMEHFISTNHEREQIHDIEVAFDADGRILGVRDTFLHDTGAFSPYGIITPLITATQVPNNYNVPNYRVEFTVAFTNKVPVSPYRGAGRPQGVFAMERLLDKAAAALGLDRAEIRRRNFVQPDEFPHDVGLIFQDGGPTTYDSGNYPEVQARALKMIGWDGFKSQQAEARAQGRYLGIGLANYVEGTGIGPYEGAQVRVDVRGHVYVSTAVSTQGQGHYTTFAQIAADELGVPLDRVTVTTGDSTQFRWGSGTYASRGLTVAGNAVGLAAHAVREKAAQIAADLLEVSPEDLEFEHGIVSVKGSPGRSYSLAALSVASNPLRYAYGEVPKLPPEPLPRQGPALTSGREPGLEAIRYYSPPHAAFASGCHAAIVEVDLDTGMVKILKYAVVHDCGVMVNPMVVEGQVYGGVAQGVGGMLYEKLDYDEEGQLRSGTYMDFLMPYATEVPHIETDHVETPSPLNPLGIKGAGEAGAIPTPSALASAIEDALSPLGIQVTQAPLPPDTLRAMIAEKRAPAR